MSVLKNPLSFGLLAAAVLTTLSAPVAAENLKEVYEAAKAYDATYLASRAAAESSRYKAAQADALVRPSVSLQAGVANAGTDTPLFGTRSTNTASLGLVATQPLFNRSNGFTIDKARKALDIAQADLASAEQDLAVRVAQAYFDVLAAQDTLATARASKTAISEQLASAKRNFEVGTATITDTREAQARFDLATAQEIAADNDVRTRRLALDQIVGRVGLQPNGLMLPVTLPAQPDPVDAWVDRSDESPSVRKARLAYDIAKLETQRTDATRLPTVDLQGQLGGAHNSGSGASSSGGTGTSISRSVGVTLKVPLYTGNAIENQVREAVSLEEKSRNELEAARRAVTQATRQVYYGVQSGTAQVKALEAAEASSKLALDATKLGYKVGVRVNLDVLNAQTQLFSTQRDLAKARYDVLVNSLKLRQAAGVLTASDIDGVNALLSVK
ncbi:TolC family outer membrane protein [Sphaerotilus montanus]|uniref:Outer membrane protein n=1 Tax=Sphaerotilus montanus TaxID=522889 RepID=A0A7Y9QTG0_9BURK|nr:TolC family outer membrane protein [Sphaerotilus montanus]NYG31098.1 outer membrane protein [Sphaerotilus montanus]NZD55084.1 TolC family outer membrane protein [Sphaerotilus montanus]